MKTKTSPVYVAVIIIFAVIVLSKASLEVAKGLVKMVKVSYEYVKAHRETNKVAAEVVHQVETLVNTLDELADEYTDYATKVASFNEQAVNTYINAFQTLKEALSICLPVLVQAYHNVQDFYVNLYQDIRLGYLKLTA